MTLAGSLVNKLNYPKYTSGANNITAAFTKTLELFFGRVDIDFAVTSNARTRGQKVAEFVHDHFLLPVAN